MHIFVARASGLFTYATQASKPHTSPQGRAIRFEAQIIPKTEQVNVRALSIFTVNSLPQQLPLLFMQCQKAIEVMQSNGSTAFDSWTPYHCYVSSSKILLRFLDNPNFFFFFLLVMWHLLPGEIFIYQTGIHINLVISYGVQDAKG